MSGERVCLLDELEFFYGQTAEVASRASSRGLNWRRLFSSTTPGKGPFAHVNAYGKREKRRKALARFPLIIPRFVMVFHEITVQAHVARVDQADERLVVQGKTLVLTP